MEECLTAVGKLTQLEDLHLDMISDSRDLAHLAGLTNLRSLSLGFGWDGDDENESDEDEMNEEVPRLDENESDEDQMNEEIPLLTQLPVLPRLETFDLRSGELNDQDIRHLAVLPRLKSLI